METIVDGNKTTRNNHRPTSFRIWNYLKR
jgi:hypothetical protein